VSRYDFPGQAAAAAQYDNACDCCEPAPRGVAPEPIEREPYADRAREWAGVESCSRAFVPSNRQEGDVF